LFQPCHAGTPSSPKRPVLIVTGEDEPKPVSNLDAAGIRDKRNAVIHLLLRWEPPQPIYTSVPVPRRGSPHCQPQRAARRNPAVMSTMDPSGATSCSVRIQAMSMAVLRAPSKSSMLPTTSQALGAWSSRQGVKEGQSDSPAPGSTLRPRRGTPGFQRPAFFLKGTVGGWNHRSGSSPLSNSSWPSPVCWIRRHYRHNHRQLDRQQTQVEVSVTSRRFL
jgi:hypothetical protein